MLRSVEELSKNAGTMVEAEKKGTRRDAELSVWQARWPRPTGRKGESGGEGPAAAHRVLHGATADW